MRRLLIAAMCAFWAATAVAQVVPGRPVYYQGGPVVRIQDGGTDARDVQTARRKLDVPGRSVAENITGYWTFAGSSFTGAVLYDPTASFIDNVTTFKDNADTTKKFQFQASGISAGTMRTFTVPNATTTLAGLGVAQTWTAEQTYESTAIYMNTGATSDVSLGAGQLTLGSSLQSSGLWLFNGSPFTSLDNYSISFPGTGGYSAILPSVSGEIMVGATGASSATRGDVLVGNSTPAWSKLAKGASGTFLKAGASDVAWASLAETDLADGSLYMRNAGAEVMTGSLLANVIQATDAKWTLKDDADTTKKLVHQLSGITTATTRTATWPDANITVTGTDATQTLTNKTVALGSNTVSGTVAQFNSALTSDDFNTLAGANVATGSTIHNVAHLIDAGTTIKDNSDTTKKVVLEASGITTATTRTYGLPNYTGNLVVSSNEVLTAETQDASAGRIASVSLSSFNLATDIDDGSMIIANDPPAGLYLIVGTGVVRSVCNSTTGWQIDYTDNEGATTTTGWNMNAADASRPTAANSAPRVIYLASGDITLSYIGGATTGTIDFFMRLIPLP